MSTDQRDREFAAFVGGRGTPLLRLAYLVTGDAELAEDRLIEALARTRNDWVRAEGTESAETYARRQLLTTRPRLNLPDIVDPAASDPRPAGSGPEDRARDPEAVGSEEDADERARELLWAAFMELPQGERAVLVLGLHESLDDQEIAHLVGRSPRAIRNDIGRALSFLRTFAEPRGEPATRPLTDRLRELFARRALDVRAEDGLAELALVRGEQFGHRRRRRVLLGTGAVAVVAVALLLGGLLGGAGSDGVASPSGSPALSGSESGSGGANVVAVPDAVLDLVRDEGALLGYGAAILDGASQPLAALVVDADPATGASQGSVIVSLARAEGGYVVLARPTLSAAVPETWTLSYVPRSGSPVELGRVTAETPGFAVSADGTEVVHVVTDTVDSSLRPGEAALVVQTLGGAVVDRVVVAGEVRPLSLDADKVWFESVSEQPASSEVWDRATGATTEVALSPRQTVTSVQADILATVDESRPTRCVSLYDAHDIQDPHRLWTRCRARSPLVLDATGGRAALLLDDQPSLVVVDAGTGETMGAASVPAQNPLGLAWTSNGQRLLLEAEVGEQVTVVGIPPPTVQSPVIGETISYPLGVAQVLLGREQPLPGG